mmetsp:Transcript_23432/g.66859  ORF Transcript_23432/g.66859 Transcript_23432/m.66859 type:complete len:239 (+) Transcript_23432:103-819(+)
MRCHQMSGIDRHAIQMLKSSRLPSVTTRQLLSCLWALEAAVETATSPSSAACAAQHPPKRPNPKAFAEPASLPASAVAASSQASHSPTTTCPVPHASSTSKAASTQPSSASACSAGAAAAAQPRSCSLGTSLLACSAALCLFRPRSLCLPKSSAHAQGAAAACVRGFVAGRAEAPPCSQGCCTASAAVKRSLGSRLMSNATRSLAAADTWTRHQALASRTGTAPERTDEGGSSPSKHV